MTTIGMVMGSTSGWDVMKEAAQICKDFGVSCDARALSAHRTPNELKEWMHGMEKGGGQAYIAGAGGAAHLAGVVASETILPVLGVPIPSKYLKGLDSLLAIVQMPKGIPVATFAIGEGGAANAALSAISMLALNDTALRDKLIAFLSSQAGKVKNAKLPTL